MNIEFTPKYLTTDWYHPVSDAYSRIRSCIDSITLNTDSTMTLKIGFDAGNGNISTQDSYNVAAYGAYIDGVEKVYRHPSSTHTFLNSTWYEKLTSSWTWYRLGTHDVTVPAATSFKLKVKGMFYYGWDNDRWNNNLGCISESTDVTVTLPEYDALVKTVDGWKKGKAYVKMDGVWKECDLYCKVDTTWKRGATF